jgi:hypothetical protein
VPYTFNKTGYHLSKKSWVLFQLGAVSGVEDGFLCTPAVSGHLLYRVVLLGCFGFFLGFLCMLEAHCFILVYLEALGAFF